MQGFDCAMLCHGATREPYAAPQDDYDLIPKPPDMVGSANVQAIIANRFSEAKITPSESCVWSCHGTGTSLGDPIEVGAVRKIQNKDPRDTTLLVVTPLGGRPAAHRWNKSQTGHLEGGAAMTSLIAAVFQVKSSVAIPCCHLRQLNPHLDQTGGFVAVFNSELNCYNYSQGNVHVSSFGFGGTNAHAIFWGEDSPAGSTNAQDVYHAPTNAELFQKRLRQMAPPEVRINGSDPALWDWDGPDVLILPGDKYSIEMNPDEPANAPQRWFKEDTGGGEAGAPCISGSFNDFAYEQMEDWWLTGLRTITVRVPASGQVEFRLFKNWTHENGVNQVIYPGQEKCSRKLTVIYGPAGEDQASKNSWLAEGIPGSYLKIDFFCCRGIRSINWMQVSPEAIM
eukprot:Skav216577  [mRNA]  locus=scaffold3598:160151:173542:+ [translate_table: standard]